MRTLALFLAFPHLSSGTCTLTNKKHKNSSCFYIFYSCCLQLFFTIYIYFHFLVQPGSPTLTVANQNDLIEGTTTNLTCSTTGGNPVPEVRWYRNSQTISGASLLPPGDKFGTTRSVLQWQVSRSDDGATFQCEVENEASSQPISDSHTMSVKCKFKTNLTSCIPSKIPKGFTGSPPLKVS